jgi:hypothetical protein
MQSRAHGSREAWHPGPFGAGVEARSSGAKRSSRRVKAHSSALAPFLWSEGVRLPCPFAAAAAAAACTTLELGQGLFQGMWQGMQGTPSGTDTGDL